MFITDNVIAPPSSNNPFYAAIRGGDQSQINGQDVNANPCLDEITRDFANGSSIVQQAINDARDAYSLPSGFPEYDLANTGNFVSEGDRLNYDATVLDEKAGELTAHGGASKVVAMTNLADRVRNINTMMWDKYNAEQTVS